MSQINNEYYPKERPFTEISVRFFGSRMNPRDVMCYLKLLSLSEKLGIKRPEYLVDSNFFSYGNYLRYEVNAILNDTEKQNNIKAICNQLIRYGVQTNSIPIIEFIRYGEQTTLYTLKDYLKSKGIKLEELNIEELTEKGKTLERTR